MTTYLLGRAPAARIAAYLCARDHPRAQAAGRALADALARDEAEWSGEDWRPSGFDVTLADEHWSWIIGASASGH